MKIRHISNELSFQNLNAQWDEAVSSSSLRCPFFTHEWFYSWWMSFGRDCSLEIFVFENSSGKIQGIAPLLMRNNILYFLASQEVTDYSDFIFFPGKEEECHVLWLQEVLNQRPGLKRIELVNIPQSSPTLLFLPRSAAKLGFHCLVVKSEVAPVLKLPSSYEDYLSLLSRKNRHELKRKLKKLDALGNVEVKTLSDPEDLRPAIEKFISLHAASSAEKEKFWRKPGMGDFFRGAVERLSSKGWVELNELFLGGKTIAALLNFSYYEKLYCYNVAYSTPHALYNPGFYLFHHTIKEAITGGKRIVDFLRGREKYKYSFGAGESRIYNLILTPGGKAS